MGLEQVISVLFLDEYWTPGYPLHFNLSDSQYYINMLMRFIVAIVLLSVDSYWFFHSCDLSLIIDDVEKL